MANDAKGPTHNNFCPFWNRKDNNL